MGKKELRNPTNQRQGEQLQDYTFEKFRGMLYNSCPLDKIPAYLCYLNKNVIDRGEWFEGRPGSNQIGDGTYNIGGAFCTWIEKWERYIRNKGVDQFALYNLDLDSETDIYILGNISEDMNSDDIALAVEYNDGVIVFTPSGAYRVKYKESTDTYFAYKINPENPRLFDDSSAPPSYDYEYRYVVALSRIEGDNYMTDDRQSDGSVLEWESPTGKSPDGSRYYRQYQVNEIGVGLSVFAFADLYCGTNNQQHNFCTHFSIYRTKQLKDTENDPQYFTWVKDFPVMKAMKVDSDSATGILTAIEGTFSVEDNQDNVYDIFGNFATITYISPTSASVSPGSLPNNSSLDIAFGSSRIYNVNTSSGILTAVFGTVSFDSDDAGDNRQEIFFSDGTRAIVLEYLAGDSLRIDDQTTRTGVTMVMGETTSDRRSRRSFYDVIPDDGTVLEEVEGLNERQLSQRDIYIPLHLYAPIPNCNVAMYSSGFWLTANRGETLFNYHSVAVKPHSIGSYYPAIQFQNTEKPITEILPSDSIAIFVLASSLRYLSLAVTSRDGNSNVGEFIPRLYPHSPLDDDIGVSQEKVGSIAKVGNKRWLAFTNEPAIRELTPDGWSKIDHSINLRVGLESVSYFLKNLSPGSNPLGWYSEQSGYKLAFNAELYDVENDTTSEVFILLRYAFLPSQGVGWSRYFMEGWFTAPTSRSGIQSITYNGKDRVFLKTTEETEEDCTFDSSDRDRPYYVDHFGSSSYANGVEIALEKWFGSIGGKWNKEHFKSFIEVEPMLPTNKGNSDYNSNGLRSSQEISLEAYIDSSLVRPFGSVSDIPENGDVHFGGVKVEGREMAFVFKAATSDIIVSMIQHLIIEKYKQGSREERNMASDDHELLLSTKSFYMARSSNLGQDRVSQEIVSDSVSGTTGPDGRENSAVAFFLNTPLNNPAISGDYTVLWWVKTGSPANIQGILGAPTQYSDAFNGFAMYYYIGTNLVANSISFDPGVAFDIGIYPADISSAFEAYYNDVRYNEGNSFLPLF